MKLFRRTQACIDGGSGSRRGLNTPIKDKIAGMTLLEVLVALAVFAIAAVSITKSLGEQIANLPILEQKTLAQWVASNQMVQARLDHKFPELGRTDGNVKLANKTWYWRQVVVKTTDNDFRLIRIRISDDESYKHIITEVDSYVYNVQ